VRDKPVAPATRWRTTFFVSLGVFVALAAAVRLWGILPGEAQLYHWMVGWVSPGIIPIFGWINYLGDNRFLLPATLLLLWVPPTGARRRWWLWAGVMVAAPILEGLGKGVIARPRPEGQALGFPSGHVTAAAAYFSLAAYLVGKRLNARSAPMLRWGAAVLVVAMVGVARILLRAHWPADILAGAALGFSCVALAVWWYEHSPRSGSVQGRQ